MVEPRPPRLSLWLRELPHIAQVATSPLRRVKEVGGVEADGQPVLVFPGMMSRDQSTSLLRRTFDAHGYHSYSSGMGFLKGITPEGFANAEQRLNEVIAQEGRPPVLLGWSLGGFYARVLAQRHPQQAAMVVTMGTPFSGNRRANNAWRLYNALNDHTVDAPSLPDDPSIKPPVHTVALWSRKDGVIAPECARGLDGERDVAIEVPYRHFALGSDRRAIGDTVRVITEQLKEMR